MDEELSIEQAVVIGSSDVSGVIVGKTWYAASTGYPTNYWVRYTNRQTGLPEEAWYGRDQLTPVEDDPTVD